MSSLLLRGYSAFASGSHVSDWCDADKVTPEIAEFNVTPDKKKDSPIRRILAPRSRTSNYYKTMTSIRIVIRHKMALLGSIVVCTTGNR